MATKRHLRNAPIREAIVHFRCKPSADLATIAAFAEAQVAKEGGRAAELWQASLGLDMTGGTAGPVPSHSAAVVGRRVDSADGKEVFQLQPAGFTFSRLAPYETWEQMADAALGRWAKFASAARFEAVEHITVRYINAIQLPMPVADFADYLVVPPVIPDDLPQAITGFMWRCQFVRDQDTATVIQLIEGTRPDGQCLNLLFDIEVVAPCEHRADDIAGIRRTAERLRTFKNDIFFKFLTEQALEKYA